MKALSLSAVIHVSNTRTAINYYTSVLGFTIDFEFGDYVGLNYGDLCIHLSGPKNLGMKKTPGNAHFCIDCDELDVYYNLVLEKGAIITVPIADREYGVRDFAVDDMDGNTLVFGMAIV